MEQKKHSKSDAGLPSFSRSLPFFLYFLVGAFALFLSLFLMVKMERYIQQRNAISQTSMLTVAEATTQEGSPLAQKHIQQEFETPEYQQLYPTLYAKDANYSSYNTQKIVYLTFDDGPSGRTDEILDILNEFDVHATFFVIGKTGEKAAERMRAVVQQGSALGLHSYTHNYATVYQSVEDFLTDYDDLARLVQQNVGFLPSIFRFPDGSVNEYNAALHDVLVSEMTRRGFVYFDWNVQSGDTNGSGLSISEIVENATAKCNTEGRVILLMHDSVNMYNTVEALPKIIRAYQKAGFTFEVLTPEVTPMQFAATVEQSPS